MSLNFNFKVPSDFLELYMYFPEFLKTQCDIKTYKLDATAQSGVSREVNFDDELLQLNLILAFKKKRVHLIQRNFSRFMK